MTEIIDRAFREPYYRFLLFLAAIWRNWYWVLPFSLILGGIAGGATYYFSKDRYTSEVWIRVYMDQPYIVFPPQQSHGQVASSVQTLLQIIYSPGVMNNAWEEILRQANVEGIDLTEIVARDRPARWLANNISVRQRGESSVHVLSFTTTNPRLSMLILDSIIRNYLTFIAKGNTTRSEGNVTKLKSIATDKKGDIESLNNEYDKLAVKLAEQGKDFPTELNRMVLAAQTSIPYQIDMLKADISALEILVEWNRDVLDDEDDGTALPDSVVEFSFYQHPVVVQIIDERVALLDELEKQKPRFKTEEAKALQTIRAKIDEVDKRIERARDEFLSDLKKQLKASLRQSAHQEMLATEKRIEQLGRQIDILKEANIRNQTRDASTVKEVNETLEIVTQRNREQRIYDILMQRIDMLNTERDAQDQVDQLSEASPPQFPDDDQRFRKSGMMFVLGLVVPLLLAWGRELHRPRFYHLSQFPIMFPNVARETVAGISRSGPETNMNRREKEAFYFSVDEICNNYCFGKSFAGSGVFLFSSVRNDDGQTLLALSVAERIAQMKKKPVLLIDTHGKSPRLRNLVGVEGKASLADILEMRVSINDALVRDTQQPNLFFLPDGPSANDSSIELFSDGTFEMLLKELRNHYGTIIISTRPMERSSASQFLCNFADEVVLAVRLYNTLRQNTERLYERLYDIGKPVTSFMISGISK